MEDRIEQSWLAFRREASEVAFASFFEQTRGLVWSICLRILRDPEDAADAFQATYCRLIALAEDRSGAAEATLDIDAAMYRLAIWEAENLRKRRRRRAEREVAVDVLPESPENAPGAAELAIKRQAREQVEVLIALLPDAYQSPLLLHFFHNKTQTEIANIIGCSRLTAARRIAQGLKKLEPLARRAGLRDALRVFVATGAGLSLLCPPGGIAAGAVYGAAQAAIAAAGGAAAAGVGTAALNQTIWGTTIMNAKTMVTGLLVVVGLGIGAAVWQASGPEPLAPPPIAEVAAPTNEAGIGLPVSPHEGGTERSAGDESSNTPPSELTESTTSTATGASAQALPKMPDGPTREVSVLVQERSGSEAPIGGAELVMAEDNAGYNLDAIKYPGAEGLQSTAPPAYQAHARTDAEGIASFTIPAAWDAVGIVARHQDFVPQEMRRANPEEGLIGLHMLRGARIFGRALLRETGKPASGAKIQAVGTYQLTMAESDGRFEFRALPPASYELLAELSDLRSDTQGKSEVKLTTGGQVGGIDLYLDQGATIKGHVTDAETGKPIPGIEIEPHSEVRKIEKLYTDANGYYEHTGLPAGPLRVDIEILGAEPYLGSRLDIEVRPGQVITKDIQLDPTGTIHARVLDAAGNPVEGAILSGYDRVFGQRFTGIGAEPTDALGLSSLKGARKAKPPLLRAVKRGHTDGPEVLPVFNGQDETTVTLTLGDDKGNEEDRPGDVAGTVVDEEGFPLAGIRVELAAKQDLFAISDANGIYMLSLPDSWITALMASGDGWGTQRRSFGRPLSSENPQVVNFQMSRPRSVTGVVVDREEKPLADILVQLLLPNWGDGDLTYTTQADGQFRFDDVGDPEVDLVVDVKGYNRTGLPARFDQSNRIVLRKRGSISGVVVRKLDGQPVEQFTVKLHRDGLVRPLGTTFQSPDGSFSIDGLQDDIEQEVWVQSDGYTPAMLQNIDISGDEATQKLRFELSEEGTFQGRLMDRGGMPLANVPISYAAHYPNYMLHWERMRSTGDLIDLQDGITDAAGRFSFRASGETSSLFVHQPGFARQRVPVEPQYYSTQGQELTVALGRASRLIVNVHPQPGDRIQPRVSLTREEQGVLEYFIQNEAPRLTTVEIGVLAAGEYQLTQQPEGDGMELIQEIRLGEGEEKAVESGTQLGGGSLVLKIPDAGRPARPMQVILTPQTESGQPAPNPYNAYALWTRGARTANFNGLPDGLYGIEVSFTDRSKRFDRVMVRDATLHVLDIGGSPAVP